MNYKVGERSDPKNSNIINHIQKKHILYEKIWIYCIYCINLNIKLLYIVYQKYYIVSGLYYCIILYIFLLLIVLIVLIVSFGHADIYILYKLYDDQ